MAPMTRSLTVAALKQAGTRIITEATVTRFEGRTAFARIGTNEEPLGDFDSVIVTVGTQSINELEIPIRKMGINVRVIGDAKKPRQIYDAVDDGFKVALDI
jgi:hypothetical protein